MKFSHKPSLLLSLALVAICIGPSLFSNALPLSDDDDNDNDTGVLFKAKRSPYLRLDELSTKLYLAKNKLGGGMIDPFEIGKRSLKSERSTDEQLETEVQLAITLFDGIIECVRYPECSRALTLRLS